MSLTCDIEHLKQRRAARVAQMRDNIAYRERVERQRTPEERAGPAGTATLEQFGIGFPGEIECYRSECLGLSMVIIAAVARGLPVCHWLAPVGYPPGVATPKGLNGGLLNLAQLAPPTLEQLPTEGSRRKARRLAASPEQRIKAGVAMSVLGDSVATKLRTELWVREADGWLLPHQAEWASVRRDPAGWAELLGFSDELTDQIVARSLASRPSSVQFVSCLKRLKSGGENPPSWSDQVTFGKEPLSTSGAKLLSDMIREMKGRWNDVQ